IGALQLGSSMSLKCQNDIFRLHAASIIGYTYVAAVGADGYFYLAGTSVDGVFHQLLHNRCGALHDFACGNLAGYVVRQNDNLRHGHHLIISGTAGWLYRPRTGAKD